MARQAQGERAPQDECVALRCTANVNSATTCVKLKRFPQALSFAKKARLRRTGARSLVIPTPPFRDAGAGDRRQPSQGAAGVRAGAYGDDAHAGGLSSRLRPHALTALPPPPQAQTELNEFHDAEVRPAEQKAARRLAADACGVALCCQQTLHALRRHGEMQAKADACEKRLRARQALADKELGRTMAHGFAAALSGE
jgi:hypothetical protein